MPPSQKGQDSSKAFSSKQSGIKLPPSLLPTHKPSIPVRQNTKKNTTNTSTPDPSTDLNPDLNPTSNLRTTLHQHTNLLTLLHHRNKNSFRSSKPFRLLNQFHRQLRLLCSELLIPSTYRKGSGNVRVRPQYAFLTRKESDITGVGYKNGGRLLKDHESEEVKCKVEERLVYWIKAVFVEKWYDGFSSLVAVPSTAPLGLCLLGILGRVSGLLGVVKGMRREGVARELGRNEEEGLRNEVFGDEARNKECGIRTEGFDERTIGEREEEDLGEVVSMEEIEQHGEDEDVTIGKEVDAGSEGMRHTVKKRKIDYEDDEGTAVSRSDTETKYPKTQRLEDDPPSIGAAPSSESHGLTGDTYGNTAKRKQATQERVEKKFSQVPQSNTSTTRKKKNRNAIDALFDGLT